ncbi:MAG TPA: 6-phosphogluconolactonase [Candidatus Stackebrandtia faecavium]|nr:6-phosphogluconolactonase [Candidatus Stackebrandtia faecavium]
MTSTSVVVHPNSSVLALSVAARLATTIIDAQAERGEASVVLTGGRIASSVYSQLGRDPVRHAIDWSRVDFWWGDERFVSADDEQRNDLAARRALLDVVGVPPHRIHAMPASGGPTGDDPEAAAAQYAEEMASFGGQRYPHFDVVLLGVGEDAHVASIFPGHPAVYETRTAVAVRGAPKPPPQRITLTYPVINSGQEVWLLASGSSKADAVGLAMSGGGFKQAPAAGVSGLNATRWLLDRQAAAMLPDSFNSPLR